MAKWNPSSHLTQIVLVRIRGSITLQFFAKLALSFYTAAVELCLTKKTKDRKKISLVSRF